MTGVTSMISTPIDVETTGGRGKATLGVSVMRDGKLTLRVEGTHGCDREADQEVLADITVSDIDRLLDAARTVERDGSVSPDGTIYHVGVDLCDPACAICGFDGDDAEDEPLVADDEYGDLVHPSCAADIADFGADPDSDDVERLVQVIGDTHAEMARRYVTTPRGEQYSGPQRLIAIDEVQGYLRFPLMGREVLDRLVAIAKRGRGVGISVELATSDPAAVPVELRTAAEAS